MCFVIPIAMLFGGLALGFMTIYNYIYGTGHHGSGLSSFLFFAIGLTVAFALFVTGGSWLSPLYFSVGCV